MGYNERPGVLRTGPKQNSSKKEQENGLKDFHYWPRFSLLATKGVDILTLVSALAFFALVGLH